MEPKVDSYAGSPPKSPIAQCERARSATEAFLYQRLELQNGYLVLRFLAEDAGKRLDAVLDAILRALARRRGPADEEKDDSAPDG